MVEDLPDDPAARLSRITDRQILRALEYWRSKAGDRPMPDRREIDPVEIPDLLPYIVLWDVLPDGYRCRLAGTSICDIHERELRGLTAAELHGPANASIQLEYDYVVRTTRPHYMERTMFWQHKDYKRYKRILLPLSDGGSDVRIIMNVASYETD